MTASALARELSHVDIESHPLDYLRLLAAVEAAMSAPAGASVLTSPGRA